MAKKKKSKIKYTTTPSGTTIIHLDPNDLTIRNEMHFNVQKNTKAQVFKDKTKYTRKRKHKNKEE